MTATPTPHTLLADDGVVLTYYELQGADTDAPAVITSAGMGALDAARRFASLSPKVRVFGFGFRGMGDTAGTGPLAVTVEGVARDLHAVLLAVAASTGLARVSLIGNSMGANIIWRMVDLFGEARVDRLVCIDQPACVRRAFGGRDAIRGLLPALRLAACMEPLVHCVLPRLRGVHFGALADLIRDSEATDNTERLQRPCISRPCLLYAGEASFIPGAVAEARWIAERVGGPARLLVYPKPHGTHSPQMPSSTDAAAAAAALRFCDDVRAFLLTAEAALRAETKPRVLHGQ